MFKAPAFRAGDQTLAVGFGLGVGYGYPKNTVKAPAFAFIYDVGVSNELGPGTLAVGGIVGYKTARFERTDWLSGQDFSASWRNLIIAARGSYHIALAEGFENLDLYSGISAGLRLQNHRTRAVFGAAPGFAVQEYDRKDVRPIVGFFGGARYNFTPQIGAWLEVGYDVSLIKGGIHFNL